MKNEEIEYTLMGEQTPEMQHDLLMWDVLLDTYRKLKAAKPDERSERARRYAVAITEYEKAMAYFHMMIIGEFQG